MFVCSLVKSQVEIGESFFVGPALTPAWRDGQTGLQSASAIFISSDERGFGTTAT